MVTKRVMFLITAALILVIILAACGAAATPAPTSPPPATATTAAAKAPDVPADHAGRAQCLVCHQTGVSGAPKMPTANPDHITFSDANSAQQCFGCHKKPA